MLFEVKVLLAGGFILLSEIKHLRLEESFVRDGKGIPVDLHLVQTAVGLVQILPDGVQVGTSRLYS